MQRTIWEGVADRLVASGYSPGALLTWREGARATSSLPVPDSPTSKTGTSMGAIRSIRRNSVRIAALRPISPWNEGGSLTSIPARLPEPGRPRGPGQNDVRPHEGQPWLSWALDALTWRSGRRPLCSGPSDSRHILANGGPSMSIARYTVIHGRFVCAPHTHEANELVLAAAGASSRAKAPELAPRVGPRRCRRRRSVQPHISHRRARTSRVSSA